jgi:uncharacterized membrane protein (DUF4010 family)
MDAQVWAQGGSAAWQAAAIALAIGFLIGAERERDGGPAGVRTFALAGLAGAGAALVHPIVLGFAVAGAAVIMAAGYLRPTLTESSTDADEGNGGRKDRLSTASTVALVLTVLLGGLAVRLPALAAGAGVATAVILLAKEHLHSVIRDKVTDLELTDALKFFVVAFIVLPLMPHASLGPQGVVDPRRMWTFVVAVTALGWIGYVAVRLAGPERGLPAAGLAGGFVSSAATTGAMARTSRDPALFRPAMAAALLATVASLAQLVLITAVADTRVAWLLVPAVATGAVVLLAEVWWLLYRRSPNAAAARPGAALFGGDAGSRDAGRTDPEPERSHGGPATPSRRPRAAPVIEERGTVTVIDFGAPSAVDEAAVDEAAVDEPAADRSSVDDSAEDETRREHPPERRRAPRGLVGRRPFALVPALLLTAILTVFLVLSAVVHEALGAGAATVAIAVAGLADSHAGALTAANLSSQSALTTHAAVLATIAAVAANTVVKVVLAHIAGGRRASTALATLFAAPAVAVAIALTITLSLAG